ncbi:MAG: VCBS repeat-containing protein [Armatimonadota bacterium]|nr:MAG: VCBS repeat-containing protein [Armatimonadota bacterium]
MTRRFPIIAAVAVLIFAVVQAALPALADQGAARDALDLVRAHADAMLRYGTDHYGPVQTHFFTQMIDLRTLQAPTQRTSADWAAEARQWNEDTDYSAWGKFWNAKESPQSGNLGRDAEFLNALYDLSDITGDRTYADAADAYLRDFLAYAVHPDTGFFATGAHLSYDLLEDRVSGKRHEMERQIIPYERIWDMKPEAITDYADAIVAGHFQDRERYGWNRHSDWDTCKPGIENANFPEYGAGYTYLWAFAYSRTKDPKYREWMQELAVSYASKGDPDTARFPTCWWADRRMGNPIVSRDNPGMAQLYLKACEIAPNPWVLSSALAHLDDCYRDHPRWEQAAWSAYWQGKPWGGTTALLAYKLTGDTKYVDWARGFAERFADIPRPKAMMAMMVAGNMDFLTQLYLATGERRWLDQATEFVALARQFQHESGLLAGAIGLDRPLYYDATQGPGYLCEALLRLYRASLQTPDPKAYVKQRLSFPSVVLERVPHRWPSSRALTMRARIDAPLGIANPRLEYTRDDVIGFSAPGRKIARGTYEFTIPAMGPGFDGEVSVAASAGNGANPLNWRTSRWHQVSVYPQETAAVRPGATRIACAADVEVSVAPGGGTLSVSRYRWNPVSVEPTDPGAGVKDYVRLSGTAVPVALRVEVRPETVQDLIAESLGLAHWRDGRWQPVESAFDRASGTLSTAEAAAGVWTIVGQSRMLWSVFEPNSYYAPAVADWLGNGKLQLLMPTNGRWGGGACGLIDGEGNVSFQQKDRLPYPGMRFAPPAAADVNGDGAPEAVAASEDGNVWCIDRSGNVLWGYFAGDRFWTPVAVGDVAGDDTLEVAASCDNGFLYLLDASGAVLWKRDFGGGTVETSPVMADVDGDGTLDVLAGSGEGKVMALRGDGSVIWEYDGPPGGANCVTAADLDGDGRVEVALSFGDGQMQVLDAQGAPRWSYRWEPSEPDLAGLYQSAAADINGDGKREIVVGTEDGYCLAFSHDGKLLWSADMEERAFGCPTLLDLDADGDYEIVMASTGRVIKAIQGDGSVIWRFKHRTAYYHTVAADVNGDGLVEIFAATPGTNHCLRTGMRCKPYEVLWGMQRGDARRSAVR